MIHWNFVDSLSTAQDTIISAYGIEENVLVAAAQANSLQLAEELLSENLSVASNTPYFGEAFATAASSGSLSMILI